jgi:thiol-disulfide isomerase/thioredoxin
VPTNPSTIKLHFLLLSSTDLIPDDHPSIYHNLFSDIMMMRTLKALSSQYHTVKNMAEFNKLVESLKTPYVLDFYADWCGPCKMLWPVLEKREKESQGKWTIIKIDADNEELAEVINGH